MENCNSVNIFISRAKSLQGNDSVKRFAEKIGIAQQKVDKYLKEETKPPIEFLVKVATRFGVSTDWLLGLDAREKADETEYRIKLQGQPEIRYKSMPSDKFSDRVKDLKKTAEQATASINALQTAIEKLNRTI